MITIALSEEEAMKVRIAIRLALQKMDANNHGQSWWALKDLHTEIGNAQRDAEKERT